MNDDIRALLITLVQPNGNFLDSLYGRAGEPLRASIMHRITNNPKLPKSQCGINAVFEALIHVAGINTALCKARQEAELVDWIVAYLPQQVEPLSC